MDLGVVSSQPATVAWSVLAGEPTLMGIGLPGVGGATELIFTANGTWLLRARVSDAGGREDARVYRIDVDAPLAPVLAGQVLEGDGVATPRAGLPVRLVWHDDADRVTTIRSATTAHDGSWSFAGVIIPVDELRVVVGP
jgi:hypothetical protein